MRKSFLVLAALGVTSLFLVQAFSTEDTATSSSQLACCQPDNPVLDKYRYLRALSVDLRGSMPQLSEIEALDAQDDVPQSWIDDWLGSDAFAGQVVRLHEGLLWNNVTNQPLMNAGFTLTTSSGLYYRRQTATIYRGMTVPCNNVPATFDKYGTPVTTLQSDGSRREGYVTVAPYWAPTTSLKVCAFDAQSAQESRTGTRCDTRDGLDDPACGCGPDLRWCSYGTSMTPVLESMAEDVDRRIASVIKGNTSYLDLFNSRTAWVNGPLVHYWKYQTEVYGNLKLTPVPIPLDRLPDLKFTDRDTWVPIELSDAHAGLLTSPAYLLRFQTNRARANRFYNAFLCQPFQPPEGGLPAGSDSIPDLDLQVRDGCNYCHAVLEPASAYWGRWTVSGAGYLSPESFQPLKDDCQVCALTGQSCSDECKRYYVVTALTSEEDPYLGWLKSYEFLHDEDQINVAQGPRLLVNSTVGDGRLPTCVARTAFQWMMGRDVNEQEQDWLDELSTDFVQSGYNYRSLIKSIVENPAYRRVQ